LNTFCVIDPQIYELILSKGFIDDFSIRLFDVTLGRNNYPNPQTSEYNYFIKLPQHLPLSQCQDTIREYMNKLVSYGFFQNNEHQSDFMVVFPHSHRENNTHGGCCYITFKPNVNKDYIAMGLIFIHDRIWPGTDYRVMCSWCKIRKLSDDSDVLPKPKPKFKSKSEEVTVPDDSSPVEVPTTGTTGGTDEFVRPKKGRVVKRRELNTVKFPTVVGAADEVTGTDDNE
jgi:hypothetical protein